MSDLILIPLTLLVGFIAVTTGLYSKKDFEKNGAKIIIKDIREVASMIQ